MRRGSGHAGGMLGAGPVLRIREPASGESLFQAWALYSPDAGVGETFPGARIFCPKRLALPFEMFPHDMGGWAWEGSCQNRAEMV